jgi:hypothetical protein
MGRKSRYETHVLPYIDKVRDWIQLLTEDQIAKRLGVGHTSLQKYKKEHPELAQALKEGREELVENLKMTLKKKAQGFYYEETKTVVKQEDGAEVKIIERYKKYAQPDTGAAHLLLKNLDESWRNDDAETMKLKRDRLELDKQKAEDAAW